MHTITLPAEANALTCFDMTENVHKFTSDCFPPFQSIQNLQVYLYRGWMLSLMLGPCRVTQVPPTKQGVVVEELL